jgi:DNA-binding NarL/FixJ family response regulator
MSAVRVLIVDDNPDFLQATREILSDDFTVVGELHDGKSVVREAARLEPQVIVLDISLGDITGFDVARRLKAAGSGAKVVFLSIHESEEFVRTAITLGAAGYVFKSQAAFELSRAVAAAVNGKTYFPKGLPNRA